MRPKKEFQPHWRPNFSVRATLPDIKLVRTGFIVNFISFALLLLCLGLFLQSEYRIWSMRATVQELEQRIRLSEAEDQRSLELSGRFRELAAHAIELQRFYSAPLPPHELLAELAVLKPKDLVFSRVLLTEEVVKEKKAPAQMRYRIQISGDVPELTLLNQYKGALQQSRLLNPDGFDCVVDESMQQRDAITRIIPFEIWITLSAAKKPGSGKGGKG